MKDKVRIKKQLLRVGDLIEHTKGVGQVLSIENDEAKFKGDIKVQAIGKTVLVKDIKVIYKRNKLKGFDRINLEAE